MLRIPAHQAPYASVKLKFSHPGIRNPDGTLDVLEVETGADQIQWSYNLNTSKTPTYGGEVIQVLSTNIDQLIITGTCRDYTELDIIYDWFKKYLFNLRGAHINNPETIAAKTNAGQQPVHISYPHRGWEWDVYVVEAPQYRIGRQVVAPQWRVVCEFFHPEDKEMLEIETKNSFIETFTRGITPHYILRSFEGLYSDPLPKLSKGEIDLVPPEEIANTMGDNFQRMIAAWSFGDFARFAYDSTGLDQADVFSKTSDEYFKQVFGSDIIQLATGGAGAGAGGGSTGGVGAYTSSLLSNGQNTFANTLAGLMNIEFGTIATWIRAEGPMEEKVRNPRHPEGDYNYLNVGQNDSGPTDDADGNKFATPEGAAQETFRWIREDAASSIKAFLTTMPGKTVEQQLQILMDSPWASSHYNGTLITLYQGTIKPSITQVAGAASGPSGPVRNKMVQIMKWLNDNKTRILYSGVPPTHNRESWTSFPTNQLLQPLNQVIYMDCSSSAQAIYTWAGGPDLDGQGGSGTTFSQEPYLQVHARVVGINAAKPGDVIYRHNHVAVVYSVQNGGMTLFNHGGPNAGDIAQGLIAFDSSRWPNYHIYNILDA